MPTHGWELKGMEQVLSANGGPWYVWIAAASLGKKKWWLNKHRSSVQGDFFLNIYQHSEWADILVIVILIALYAC